MKSYLSLFSLVLFFGSCTSAYKSGQTPDDVYFSPARPQEDYARVEKNDDRQYYGDMENYDDRYLRMKVQNRRWSTLEDTYYYNYYPSPYLYNTSWTAYSYWNTYYNPYYSPYSYYSPYCYCTPVIIANPKATAVYNKPRFSNLRVFDNIPVSTDTKTGYNNKTYSAPKSTSTDRKSTGTTLRNVFFGKPEGNTSNSGSNNLKTYSPSSSDAGNSGSSNTNSSGSSSNSSRGNATRGKN